VESLKKSDPKSLGPWKLLSRLGSGGMSVVYFASKKDSTFVALKVIRSQFLDNKADRSRVEREIKTLSSIKSKYVCEIIDSEINEDFAWIATKYIDGPDLKDKVESEGKYPYEDWLILARDLLQGLDDIHSYGVIHRDVKPTNILIENGVPKFIDFGIAQTSESTSLTSTGLIAGSPAWLSPEQITGKRVTYSSDVFSLGAVLNFAARAASPWGDYQSSTRDVLYNKILQKSPDNDGLDDFQKEFISKLINKNPINRLSTKEAKNIVGKEFIRLKSEEELFKKQKEASENRLKQELLKKEQKSISKKQKKLKRIDRSKNLTSTELIRPNLKNLGSQPKKKILILGIVSVFLVSLIPLFLFANTSAENVSANTLPTSVQTVTPEPRETIQPVEEFSASQTISPEPSPTKTSPNPSKESETATTTETRIEICRTIKQFGEEKQCFKLSETTQLTVESRYGDCPVVAASYGTCDIGTVVIVPTDRGAVIKPCSPGGDIKYSVNGNIGGIIGGGEPSSLRNETCLTKSNNTNPYILNYFPPLSFLPNVVSDVRYLLPEIGVEVLDEYIN
jgi:serine/threonine protein kinase